MAVVIGLKDFRNFHVLLFLINSSRRKFGFNLAQTWLWCKTMAIMANDRHYIKKGVDISRGSAYLLGNKTLPGVLFTWRKKTREYLFASKLVMGSAFLGE